MTRQVGIIGYPLGHTLSPVFQQAAFDFYGLDVRYQVWETEPSRLAEAVVGLRRPEVLGANVTIPFKQAVMPLLDEVDSLARQIGAVNTVVNQEGRLVGHNTDAEGFLRALRREAEFDPAECRAVLLGAGGAARAVAFALAQAGAKWLDIVNRTEDRARALAQELRDAFPCQVEGLPWSEAVLRRALAEAELVVNCTSIGMRHSATEGQSPVRSALLFSRLLVYDLVYNPPLTPLLQEAERASARTLGGLPMLVYQGAAAFELWTGRRAPVELMMETASGALGN